MRLKRDDIKSTLSKPLKDIIGHEYVLTGIRPYFEYVNGKRTDKQLGFAYEIVLLDRVFEKVPVRIVGAHAQIDEDKITGKGVPVVFENLTENVYATASNEFVNYQLTLTATAVKIKGGGANA
jgi:hypothetical protein